MKVVCCGQIKTGTKSMAKLFKLLKLKVNSNPICLKFDADYILLDNNYKYYTNSKINAVDKNISLFQAFHDYPYSYNYEYIHSLYPDTYFILTIREPNDWFNSFLKYQNLPGATNWNLIKKLYGHNKFTLENKEEIIKKYNTYNKNIEFFFKDKPNLLIINLCNKKDDDENKILQQIKDFLNINFNFKLPHENKQ